MQNKSGIRPVVVRTQQRRRKGIFLSEYLAY